MVFPVLFQAPPHEFVFFSGYTTAYVDLHSSNTHEPFAFTWHPPEQ
jgi:hypothetical protein